MIYVTPNSTTALEATATSLPGGIVAQHHVLVDASGGSFGSGASPVYMNSVANFLASQQKAFVAATGVLSLTAAGNLRITFSNPVGSGVTAYINAMTTLNTGSAAATANFYLNPNAGLPTSSGTIMNAVVSSGNVAKCSIKGDTNLTIPVSGGTTLIQISVPQTRTVYNQGQFIVPAGQTIGMNLIFAGAASGELVVYYAEV